MSERFFKTEITRHNADGSKITITMEAPYESVLVAKATMIDKLNSIIPSLQKGALLDVEMFDGDRLFFQHKKLTPKGIKNLGREDAFNQSAGELLV
jgi:hypothetical protein